MSEELQKNEAPSNVSTEFPVVVLGDEGLVAAPGKRLLVGRVPESYVLYPIYLLVVIAGAFAATFALGSDEWSVVPVSLTWGTLYVWYWFYGVAYRYRRRVLKYTSVVAVLSMSGIVSLLCLDRAESQVIATAEGLATRPAEATLVWAAFITTAAGALLLVHLGFLGRGYREKKVRDTPSTLAKPEAS